MEWEWLVFLASTSSASVTDCYTAQVNTNSTEAPLGNWTEAYAGVFNTSITDLARLGYDMFVINSSISSDFYTSSLECRENMSRDGTDEVWCYTATWQTGSLAVNTSTYGCPKNTRMIIESGRYGKATETSEFMLEMEKKMLSECLTESEPYPDFDQVPPEKRDATTELHISVWTFFDVFNKKPLPILNEAFRLSIRYGQSLQLVVQSHAKSKICLQPERCLQTIVQLSSRAWTIFVTVIFSIGSLIFVIGASYGGQSTVEMDLEDVGLLIERFDEILFCNRVHFMRFNRPLAAWAKHQQQNELRNLIHHDFRSTRRELQRYLIFEAKEDLYYFNFWEWPNTHPLPPHLDRYAYINLALWMSPAALRRSNYDRFLYNRDCTRKTATLTSRHPSSSPLSSTLPVRSLPSPGAPLSSQAHPSASRHHPHTSPLPIPTAPSATTQPTS